MAVVFESQRNAFFQAASGSGTAADPFVLSGGSGLTIGGAISGGTDTRVLFNDGGALADNSAFTFTKATGLLKTTALALGGAIIGSNALAVTGTALFNSAVSITSGTGTGLTIQGGISVASGGAGINGVSGIVNSLGVVVGSGSLIGTASSTFGTTIDVNFNRASAGIYNLGTTAANALGSLNLVALTGTGAVTAWSGTAIPAGGTTGSGFKFSSTANYGVFFGSGAPSLSAAKGSLYLRSDGSTTNDRAYINSDGGTTWTALTTAA